MFEALADLLAYELMGLDPVSHVGQAVHFFILDVVKILVLLVIIIYLMGLVRALLSPERVRDYVRGKPRWLARLLAILLGAVTPFCSCSSVPLFIGFVEAGIPLGVTFSFLIASPMINEVAVVILADVIGWELTALYVLTGLTVAYLGGAVMERFDPERWIEPYVLKIQAGGGMPRAEKATLRTRHDYAVNEVREIVGRVWHWIIIGVGVGALFHGFVPESWVADNLGGTDNPLVVPAAVVVGVPLYSNAIGVVPVVEALLGKGVALGTVLAFMMSVATLSLPEMIILRRVVRWPALGLFAGIMTAAFVLVGWLFNALA